VEIVLVRHGQPDWEPGGAAVDDPGLTPHGHAQAGCVAEALAGERFDGFYVSPLCRAQETARPIAERLGLEPKTESWLRELDLPPMEGMAPEEVQDFFASARARELAHWWDGFPGGESFRHFYERIEGGVESLLVGEHAAAIHEETEYRIWRLPDAGSRLLVVAHEGTNAVILSTLLGIEPVPWAWLRFSSAWAGMSRIHSVAVAGGTGAVWALEAFNRTEHLAALEAESDGRYRGD
jgi:broad specificity phosphatase PhoE